MKRLLVACVLAVGLPAAKAQLYSFPAPPMTVADCPAGKIWIMKSNLPTCDFPAPPPPPPPPCCAPPPPPACLYEYGRFFIYLGDMGECTADGGCEGVGYAIYYGGLVASEMWRGHQDPMEWSARAIAAIEASGYRLGAYKTGSMSNGNNNGSSQYEVCK